MSFYTAKVSIDGDDSALQEKIRNANNKVAKTDQDLDRQAMKIAQIWSYGMHITNLVISNLSRVAQTEEQATHLKNIQMGIGLVQTELSIVQTGYQAAVAFTTGQIAQGVILTSVAILMQTLLIQQQVAKREMELLAVRQAEVRRFYEAYR